MLKRKRAEEHYLELVRDIPEVVEVRLADDDEGAAIWTIISATPFDDGPRDRVIEAQIDVQIDVMKGGRCALGFRLINLEELDHAFRDDYVSSVGNGLMVTGRKCRARNELVIDRTDVGLHYVRLYHRSLDARYNVVSIPSSEVNRLRMDSFSPIRDNIRMLLGLS